MTYQRKTSRQHKPYKRGKDRKPYTWRSQETFEATRTLRSKNALEYHARARALVKSILNLPEETS